MSDPTDAPDRTDGSQAAGPSPSEPAPPAPTRPAVPQGVEDAVDEIYRVQLDVFEGPLDLLLHLIQKHELDIFDIPISFVTSKYLQYLDVMRSLQIDVASEYLVMAATLAYIKSQMLLPEPPSQLGEGEEGAEPEDPRAELVRRLLEYQKYKDAAGRLSQQPMLGRDVFERGTGEPEPEEPASFAQVAAFKLFEAFDRVLKRAGRKIEHEVVFDRISITERIIELTELLHGQGRIRFEELFGFDEGKPDVVPSRFSLVVTFLALLEMCRLGVARVQQEEHSLGQLWVEFAARGSHLAGAASAGVPSPGAEQAPSKEPPSVDEGERLLEDDDAPAEPEAAQPPGVEDGGRASLSEPAAPDDDSELPR